jgi:hypothetical protein
MTSVASSNSRHLAVWIARAALSPIQSSCSRRLGHPVMNDRFAMSAMLGEEPEGRPAAPASADQHAASGEGERHGT